MEIAISIFLTALGIYFFIGILFGLYFIFSSAPKIDPLLASSKKMVRLLLMPGVVITWPILLIKLFKHKPI